MPIVPGLPQNTTQGLAEPGRQISVLEDNIRKALTNIANQALPRLKSTNLKVAAYTALLDDLVPCNGTFTITLPVASANNQGRCIAIEVKSGAISVISASGLVQGIATDLVNVAGLYVYVSDGMGWWRFPFTSVTNTDGTISVTTVGGIVTIGASSAIVTSTALNNAVGDVRREVEKMRVLILQLAKIMLGQNLDSGIEGL